MATAAASDTTRLPRQVRERMERIRQAESQATEGADPPPQIDTPPPPPPADPAAGPTPPAAPATPAAPSQPEFQTELRPFNDPALATDPRAANPEYWRNRLSVVQGKLREALTTAHARESELQVRIEALEAEVATLKQNSGTAAPAPVDLTTIFTADQIEALGDEQASALATAAITAARQQVEATLSQRTAAETTQRERDAERQHKAKWKEFLVGLEEVVPNWAQIDARTDWREWLAQIDPATGVARQAALTAANRAYDVQATAAIFAAFTRALAPRPAPPVATPPRDAGGTPPQAPKGPRDLSAVPPSSEEISDYYKRSALNKVSAQERVEFEKRLALL